METIGLEKSETTVDKSIRVLCVGEQQVGKSSFLSRAIQQQQYRHIKDSPCQVFLKRFTNSSNRRVWVQFYQLSNTYPEYLSCYVQQHCDAIIFFYDLTDKRSRNRLYVWLKLVYEAKRKQIWKLPVLLIGLKKNLIIQQELAILTKDVETQFKDIFKPDSFLYFGFDSSWQQQYFQFKLFIKRVISKKFQDSSQWYLYLLENKSTIFRFMYTYTELAHQNILKLIDSGKQLIEIIDIPGIIQKASNYYLKFTDKLSTY